jgi:predicted nucleic acid-binding protein
LSDDAYLIDTSVLVRVLAEDDARHAKIKSAVSRLAASGAQFYFTPQVARESWSVLTRPVDVNGYGMNPAEALISLKAAHEGFEFAPDTPDIYTRWLALVEAHGVSGRQVHDAYHVAAMMAHGLTKVLTLDRRDFARYSGIEVVIPDGL